MLASASLLAAAAMASASAPYPTAQVLDAVRAACSDLSSPGAAQAKVETSGWTRAADIDATPVGPMVRFGYEAGAKMVKGRGKLDNMPAVYSRDVAGETLHLVISAIRLDGTSVIGCRAYDANETRPLDIAAAQRWAGRAPDDTIDSDEFTKLTWEPGLTPGQDSFEIYRVPAGSPMIQITKLAGLAFKADQVGTATP